MVRQALTVALAAGAVAVGCGDEATKEAQHPDATRTPPQRPAASPGARPVKIDVGSGPGYLVAAFGLIWSGNHQDGTVEGIDPASNKVVRRISVPGEPTGISAGFGSLWTFTPLGDDGPAARRLDPRGQSVLATIPVRAQGGSLSGPLAAAGAMWLAGDDGWLTRIDPARNRARRVLRLPKDAFGCAGAMAVARGDLFYVPECGGERVLRIDARRHRIVGEVPVRDGLVVSLTRGGGRLWGVTSDGAVVAIDPRRERVTARKQVADQAERILYAAGRLRVRAGAERLTEVDPKTLRVVTSYPLPAAPVPGGGLAATRTAAWAANFEEGTVYRFDR